MKAINLLPPDLKGAPKGASPKAKAAATTDEPAGIGAFVVLGALALCVAALAAYVLTTNTVKDRQAQLDAATAEAETTLQRVASLKKYADFQQLAETRIQTVKDLASSRFDWEQALRDISRAIPANVTLSSFTGSISDASGGGSPLRTAIAAPAIELQGCTTGQKQVADLLSRLRSVDGVTRVTLSKSLKPAESEDNAAVPTGADSDAPDCTGRAPAFEIVMFFEHSTVPSSVEDITVAGAGGTQQTGTGTGTTPANGSQPAATSVTTPPADPAASGTATPASTPQGGGAK
jgi:Tfp pilus assembly protein PilN